MCPRWVSGGASPAQDRRGQAGTGQVLGQIFVRASSCLWSHPREVLGTQFGQEECQGARNAACMRCHQRPDLPGLGAEPFGWSLVGAGAPGLGDLPRALPLHSASFRGLPPCPKYPARMGFFPAAVDSFTTCILPPALGGFPFPPCSLLPSCSHLGLPCIPVSTPNAACAFLPLLHLLAWARGSAERPRSSTCRREFGFSTALHFESMIPPASPSTPRTAEVRVPFCLENPSTIFLEAFSFHSVSLPGTGSVCGWRTSQELRAACLLPQV